MAALTVAIEHLVFAWMIQVKLDRPLDAAEQWAAVVLMLAGMAAVRIFFVLSGFVLARALDRDRYPIFLARRLARLGPVCAAVVILFGPITGAPAGAILAQAVLWPWSDFPVDSPLWTLAIEAEMALVWPLVVWAGRGSAWRAGAVAALCYAMAWGTGPGKALGAAPWFVLGIWLARTGLKAPERLRGAFAGPVPAALGRLSFSLYAVHLPVTGLCMAWLGRAGIWLAVPAVTLVTTALYVAVERPSRRWSSAIGRP